MADSRFSVNSKSRMLEDAFFKKFEEEERQRIHAKLIQKERREALRTAGNIQSERVLDFLMKTDISPDSLAALSLIPLVEVAWADGSMEAKEKKAILQAAEKNGIQKDHPAHEILIKWMENRPGAELMEAWRSYTQELKRALPNEEFRALGSTILERCRSVAESAGGFLGLTSKVSEEEKNILKTIEQTLLD